MRETRFGKKTFYVIMLRVVRNVMIVKAFCGQNIQFAYIHVMLRT